jgi:pSer/pThr/pTyr-binding forkhead associated (FHA) protein
MPTFHVHVERGDSNRQDYSFNEAFRIGRGSNCQVRLSDNAVSRHHVEVLFIGERWWIQDLGSANGTFIDGRQIMREPLENGTRIRLGPDGGPLLIISLEEKAEKSSPEISEFDPHSLTYYRNHYLKDEDDGNAGQHTMMIRQAFSQVQKKQKNKYFAIIGVIVCLLIGVAVFATVKHYQLKKQRKLAENIFYNMKTMELEFSELLQIARETKDKKIIEKVDRYKIKRREMEKNYDRFIDTLKVYKKGMTPQERLILQTARTFGECEINVPPDFTREVLRYISKWKSSQRLARAIMRAKKNGYVDTIGHTLVSYDLPPEFFYLALQESNFNKNAVGPKTRWGIAKGMWQFIPDTARRYGLKTGPLVKLNKPDPKDDRHNPEKATLAAAKYLRDIYDTDAQASGLLVMASYNWGENRVIKLIRKIPKNPRERNFWNLLLNYKEKIPKQTYDYVFYIFSAAVIGENPRLFGFNFDNPLAEVQPSTATTVKG